MTFEQAWQRLTSVSPDVWGEKHKELAAMFYTFGADHLRELTAQKWERIEILAKEQAI